MDSFGRLPNDVINIIQTLYHKPLINIITLDNKNYIQFTYPHFELKFEMFYQHKSLSINHERVVELVNLICNKSGEYNEKDTLFEITDNIVVTSGTSKLILTLDNLDRFIEVLIQYYKMITNNILDISIYNNGNYKVHHLNIIIGGGMDVIGSIDSNNTLIEVLPNSLKIFKFLQHHLI
jgi:hypothetical protein